MVALILGTGFEPLEAVAPCDILRRGGIEVCCASVGERLVEAGHGIRIEADCTVAELDAEKLDMIVLPGGLGGVQSILGSEASMTKGNLSRPSAPRRRSLQSSASRTGERRLAILALSRRWEAL